MPHLDRFLEQEATRLNLQLEWLRARLTADVVDGPIAGGFLWFSIYCLDGIGLNLKGNNLLLLLQGLGVMLTTAQLPYAGG